MIWWELIWWELTLWDVDLVGVDFVGVDLVGGHPIIVVPPSQGALVVAMTC